MDLRYLNKSLLRFLIAGLCLLSFKATAQTAETLLLQPDETEQTVVGFGASLAFYEGWLNAHPRKAEIYEAIFGELSLDILRVRNAYDYDSTMVGRVKEYMSAAEASLGHPISLFSTSWGPPGYLKNTGDRKNGGTLRYSTDGGNVEFDYPGFALWWNKSLDEYSANGIFPTYISIQNEPGFSATWESCQLSPRETINSNDTIAGYNKALDAVYDTLATRADRPMILGPETVGIGYNNVENYINALDLSKLEGISHHLYHGVNENNPYASTDFSKVGDFHPEVSHFQTEYSRGDWFSLAGLIYKSFYDEQVVAYLYWDLIWGDSGGLVTVEFPWDSQRWTDPQKGYIKTKEFYAFKQFSAFVHPGWKMIKHSLSGTDGAALTFISPTGDSASCVVINKSGTDPLSVRVGIPGYRIHESAVYSTSENKNCESEGPLVDSLLTLEPHSIATVDMRLSVYDPVEDTLAPSIPSGVYIKESSASSLTLAWNASTDSFGVTGYRIYVDGVLAGSTGDTLFVISGLLPNISYEIEITAFDNAGNESEKSDPVYGIIQFRDTLAPVLQATNSVYQEGNVVLVCSEAGVVYLVPEQTPKDLQSIRGQVMDSTEVEARKGTDLLITGYGNGVYWLYAADSAENISEPEALTILGVGIESAKIHQFHVFPNPFSQQAIFSITLTADQEIWLSLMDSQGRVLRKESYGHRDAGQHQLILHRDNLPAGYYFFRLENAFGEAKSGPLLIRD